MGPLTILGPLDLAFPVIAAMVKFRILGPRSLWGPWGNFKQAPCTPPPQERHWSRPKISEPSTSAIKLRSSTKSVNWDLCIFCQDTKVKELLCSVTTFKMSDQILNLSQYDRGRSNSYHSEIPTRTIISTNSDQHSNRQFGGNCILTLFYVGYFYLF